MYVFCKSIFIFRQETTGKQLPPPDLQTVAVPKIFRKRQKFSLLFTAVFKNAHLLLEMRFVTVNERKRGRQDEAVFPSRGALYDITGGCFLRIFSNKVSSETKANDF